MQDIIKYKGLKQLTPQEQETLKTIITKKYPEIKRMIKNITDLKVNIKVHDKEGKRKRYQIFMQAIAPTIIFESKRKETYLKKLSDWDLARATHKAVNKLKKEIEHIMKTEKPAWKKTGIKRLISRFFSYPRK